MSEHDISELAKQRAAEAVAAHLEISEKTRIKTSVRNAIGIVVAVVTGTVSVCAYLNHISNSQDRIELALTYKVPDAQLTAWANALDKANRGIAQKDGSLGLIVPDPSAFRPRPQRASTGTE